MSERKKIMLSKKLYVTTAIAYANANPHIGHAFEYVLADAYVRYTKHLHDVYFVTGMDEHGQKIEQKAQTEGIPVQAFVDTYAESFKDLDKELGVSYDFFVRTSDKEKHYVGAQKLWKALAVRGDLEKRSYKALYCIGCEGFKTEKDLNEKGECPDHLKVPEVVEEENYFFKLSKYTKAIQGKILSDELEIVPHGRRNEILALLDRGLDDVSFSRPTSKVSWGIPVPGDDTQVMYVWCDALSNYITALGYGYDSFDEGLWSNAVHVIGKDILRFHAAIWPGMLLSAGLPLPKKILVHGHITSGGQKMSKTLGNVINPRDVIEMFRPVAGELAGEVARFILLHEIPSFEDGDMTIDSIKTSYTAYLANGIGNLTSRVMKMATSHGVIFAQSKTITFMEGVVDMNANLKQVMNRMRTLDEYIATNEPFKVIKVDETKGKEMLLHCLLELDLFARELSPYMPETSKRIGEYVRENKMPESPLFGRLQ
jgi:methionyl-tRNA synthetase